MALPTTNRTTWFRVADTSTAFTTGGNPPSGVATSGQSVAEWGTSGGHSNAFNDYGGIGKPTLAVGALNGKNALRFSPTQELKLFDLAGTTSVGFKEVLNNGNAYTILLAFRLNAMPSAGTWTHLIGCSAELTSVRVSDAGNLYVRVVGAGYQTANTTGIPLATGTDYVLAVVKNGTSCSVYLNDVVAATTNTVYTNLDHTGYALTIGGDNGYNSRDLDGWIGEVVTYGAALAGQDLLDGINYMRSEWNVTIPDVSSAYRIPESVYALGSVTGLKKWVDYIPVALATDVVAADIGTYNDGGAWHTSGLDSAAGLTAWVDYIPVFIVAGTSGKQWRTDDDGWIPVTDV